MNLQNILSLIFLGLAGVAFIGGLYLNFQRLNPYYIWVVYGFALIFLGLGIGFANYSKNIYLSIVGFAISIIAGIFLIMNYLIS